VSLWQFLNQWWNLPYLVALGLVGVFFLLQLFGVAAHAISGDSELDAGAGADHDADADADHDADAGHGFDIAAFLGVGRVPFMVVWLTLFIFAGFAGLFLNCFFLGAGGAYRGWYFPLSLLGSLAIGAMAVRFAARGVHKLVDVGGRGSGARRELQGRIGTVASSRLDAQFGEIRVRDARGDELIVHGRLAPGEPSLERGADVVLVELEQDTGLFTVAGLKH